MPHFTDRDAEMLSPEQAAALVRVLDLQARWDSLLVDRQQKSGLSDLLARQKANDAYQAALRDYAAKYRTTTIPEPTRATPERLVNWCRVLRLVFGKAENGPTTQVMGKVYRLADRIAARVGGEPVAREPADDLPSAARELGVVIDWCEALVTPTA
jgi:hypothetical protein